MVVATLEEIRTKESNLSIPLCVPLVATGTATNGESIQSNLPDALNRWLEERVTSLSLRHLSPALANYSYSVGPPGNRLITSETLFASALNPNPSTSISSVGDFFNSLSAPDPVEPGGVAAKKF